jgi:hypothetical protein
MNHWVYTVLLDKVHTPSGKLIVNDHRHTSDAQSAIYELCRDAKYSVHALINNRKLYDKIYGMTLDQSYTKGAQHFIAQWHQAVETYNDQQADPQDCLTHRQMKSALRTAVNGIKSLQEVAQHEQTRMVVDHLPEYDFHQYMTLVRSAAANYDESKMSPLSTVCPGIPITAGDDESPMGV